MTFGEPVTLKRVTSHEIDGVEQFMRNNLQGLVNSWQNLTNIDASDFFGLYKINPSDFSFNLGEKYLIEELAKYVRKKVDHEHNSQYFRLQRKVNYSGTFEVPNVGRFFTKFKNVQAEQETEKISETSEANYSRDNHGHHVDHVDLTNLQLKLHQNVLALLSKATVDRTDKNDLLSQFTLENVSVNVDADGNIHGIVNCVLCKNAGSMQIEHKISSKQSNTNKTYWTLSNYIDHVSNVHKMNGKMLRSQICGRKTIKEEYVLDLSQRSHLPEPPQLQHRSDQTTVKTVEFVEPVKRVRFSDEISEICMETRITNADIQSENYFNEPDFAKTFIEPNESSEGVLTLEQVESTIHDQLSSHLLNMYNKCFGNSVRNEPHVDNQKIANIDEIEYYPFHPSEQTVKSTVKVAEIAKNGDCLLSAIIHQINGYGLVDLMSDHHEKSVLELRSNVVNYITQNVYDFENELRECIFVQKAKDIQQKQRASKRSRRSRPSRRLKRHKIEIIDFEEEATKFLSEHLSKKGFWCGAETIKAVSRIYGVNILMINEKGTVYFPTNFFFNFERMIVLAYRLSGAVEANIANIDKQPSNEHRNHYDSVVYMCAGDQLRLSSKMADIVAVPLKKSEDESGGIERIENQ